MASARRVIDFEVLRNLRKKTFWFAAVAPPVMILAIIGITHASSNNANNASQQQTVKTVKNSKIAVLDETGVISKSTLTKEHVATEPSQASGIEAVKKGSLSAFFYFPKNVDMAGIQIYAQDQGISNPTPYNGIASALLVQSAKARALAAVHSPQIVQILENAPGVTSTTYKNGVQTNDEADVIAPGVFLLAFLSLVVLQAYLMITSTTEEKENRTAEILLTSIKSRTLITGKILSLFILGVVQLLIIVVPLIVAYVIFRQHISLPGGVTLSQIPLDPKAIAFGALFFVSGVVMFTGFLVGFGSLFPSAQEAGRYLGMAIITAFIPIYAIGFILNSTHALIVSIFTYFPLTAPTTLLIRNAIGNIPTGEALIALLVVILSAVLAIAFAMKAFRYGAMEYGRRISVKELLP
jgi:ABC-2 type transport system permease protein